MIARRRTAPIVSACIAATLVTSAAADVLVPSYRGAQNSVLAVFEPNTQNLSGWNLVSTSFGPSVFPTTGNTGVGLAADGILRFEIENFIDPLPRKRMRISVECFFAACGTVSVPDVEAFDPSGIVDIQLGGSGLVPGANQTSQGSIFFDFLMFPNPDFEVFFFSAEELLVNEVARITVDTVSEDVPLPASVTLSLLGLLGIWGLGRRRAQVA
ncbi:MAG: hypothetical protein AAGG47_20765 [Pseudomonadota bacterium]